MIAATACAAMLLALGLWGLSKRLDAYRRYATTLELQLIQLRARVNELEHRH